MSVSFPVADVTPCTTRVLVIPADQAIEHAAAARQNDSSARRVPRDGLADDASGGLTTSNLPPGMCEVPFTWRYLDSQIPMHVLGGFVGVGQDERGVVRPELAGPCARPRVETPEELKEMFMSLFVELQDADGNLDADEFERRMTALRNAPRE